VQIQYMGFELTVEPNRVRIQEPRKPAIES
jgi:hypothetical protein